MQGVINRERNENLIIHLAFSKPKISSVVLRQFVLQIVNIRRFIDHLLRH